MRTRKYITTKMLESIGSYKNGIKSFNIEFPSGRATWAQCVALAGRSEDWAEYVAWLGAVCPADVEGATWTARLAVQRNSYSRAGLGRNCPSEVDGATWAARLAMQRNNHERAWLGQRCPDGVAGATLEARLAVQLDDWGRRFVRAKFGEKKGDK